jgi:hypothetical protein
MGATGSVGQFYKGSREHEQRMAPADHCTSIQIWSFYRSRQNQLRLHDAPKKCDAYVKGGDSPKDGYSGYACSKVPFYPSHEAALKAHAQGRFAYAEGGSIVIDDGTFFVTRTVEIYSQKAVGGKVLGTMNSTFTQFPAGMSEAPASAVSDSSVKANSVYPELEHRGDEKDSQGSHAASAQ